MALTVQTTSTVDSTDTASVVIPAPSGIVIGDMLVAIVGVGQSASIGSPAGWTQSFVNVNSSGSVNGAYVAVGYIKFDDPYVLQILRKTWGSLSETFGSEGLFYGLFIILTVAMVGIFNPKIAMILAVIGLVFSSILGFFNMNPSWIIALIIGAGLTIYRMRDN